MNLPYAFIESKPYKCISTAGESLPKSRQTATEHVKQLQRLQEKVGVSFVRQSLEIDKIENPN